MTPLSRAKRILKPMQYFKAAFKDGLPVYASRIPIHDNEELIGIYENHSEDIDACIVVTNRRVLLESGGQWKSVVYAQIAVIETPEPTGVQEDPPGLRVRLTTGASEIVPVHGRHGRFFDLFEFSRFLARAREDVRRGLRGTELERDD